MSEDARLLALLAKGVRRGRELQVIGGIVLVGISAGVIGGYEISSPTGPNQLNLRGLIILFGLMGLAGLYGVLFLYMGISGGARHREFMRLLTQDPQEIVRIYGARLAYTPYAAKIYTIARNQEAHPTRPGRPLIIIERRVTSGFVRALGFHKDMIRVHSADVAAVLTYLRQFAPDALGPPEPVRRARAAKPPS